MEPSNFHMFLSSNTNPVEFPDNNPSDFTTLYGETVKLDGSWEVGVKQVTYPSAIVTTSGIETLSTTKNGATILEGNKAFISARQEDYDFDTYTVEKPPYDKDKGYSPQDVVKSFNELPIVKKGIVKLIYNEKKSKMILDISMDDVLIGFSYDFGFQTLRFLDIGYTYGNHWAEWIFFNKFQSNEKWSVWVFPLYRLTKEVFTICEKDVDMTSDDMIKRIQVLTKDYGVEWKYVSNGKRVGFHVKTKPDPKKDVKCSFICFNDATMDMLLQPHAYFEANYADRTWADRLTRKESYRDCEYYGREPMLMYIYNREISNRSPFQPEEIPPEWTTFTFPRKRFATPEELLTTLKSFKPPSSASVQFSYDSKVKRFKVNVPFSSCLRMDPIICDILGFKNRQYFVNGQTTADYTPALDRAVDNLFVYSNITDAVFVGNVKAPLLCIVPREKGNSQGSKSWSSDSPTYMSESCQSFNQQWIVIMDEAGIRVF